MPAHRELSALIALVIAVASGCGKSEGAFRFRWQLAWAQGRGAVSCASANARSILIEVSEQSTGEHREETFPCDATEGAIAGLAPGSYTVWFQLYSNEFFPTPGLDRSSDLVDAQVGPYVLDAGSTQEVTLEVPLSYVSLDWRIVRGTGAIGCDEAGAAQVRVIPVVGKFTVLKNFDLDCSAGSGMTDVIPVDLYHGTVVQLIGKAGEELDSVAAPPEPHAANFDLRAGSVMALGTVELRVP